MPTDVPTDRPVMLFDGVCNICNWSVQFVIDHDPDGRIHFAPLQSDSAAALLADVGVEDYDVETVVLVEDGAVYTKTDAWVRVVRLLDRPWSLLRFLRVVPGPIRDWVYERIADYRYLVFGKKAQCMVPSPEVRDRFLEMDAVGE